MKRFLLTLSIILAAAFSAHANDGVFVSKVIHETDSPHILRLPSKKFIKITNFIQVGGNVVVSPDQPDVGAVVVYQGPAGLSGITVATAGGPNSSHEVLIAGPAVVYVGPVKGGTLFLSYLFGSND